MPGRTRNTRVALLQALTPASVGEIEIEETTNWMRKAGLLEAIDEKRFDQWFLDILPRLGELDQAFEPHLNSRSLHELGHAELAMLRIAAYELLHTEVPRAVAINEWVEIAKEFGAENSFRFVNGVLDNLANATRENTAQHE